MPQDVWQYKRILQYIDNGASCPCFRYRPNLMGFGEFLQNILWFFGGMVLVHDEPNTWLASTSTMISYGCTFTHGYTTKARDSSLRNVSCILQISHPPTNEYHIDWYTKTRNPSHPSNHQTSTLLCHKYIHTHKHLLSSRFHPHPMTRQMTRLHIRLRSTSWWNEGGISLIGSIYTCFRCGYDLITLTMTTLLLVKKENHHGRMEKKMG